MQSSFRGCGCGVSGRVEIIPSRWCARQSPSSVRRAQRGGMSGSAPAGGAHMQSSFVGAGAVPDRGEGIIPSRWCARRLPFWAGACQGLVPVRAGACGRAVVDGRGPSETVGVTVPRPCTACASLALCSNRHQPRLPQVTLVARIPKGSPGMISVGNGDLTGGTPRL